MRSKRNQPTRPSKLATCLPCVILERSCPLVIIYITSMYKNQTCCSLRSIRIAILANSTIKHLLRTSFFPVDLASSLDTVLSSSAQDLFYLKNHSSVLISHKQRRTCFISKNAFRISLNKNHLKVIYF